MKKFLFLICTLCASGIAYADSCVVPSEYTQLEYLQSTGTQYIDTGIKRINNSEFDITFQLTDTDGSYSILSAHDGTDSSNGKTLLKSVWATSSEQYFMSQPCYNGYGLMNIQQTDTQKHTVNITTTSNTETVIIDNDTPNVGNFTITTSTRYSLYLFARNRQGSMNTPAHIKVYSLSIRQDNVLIQELIPARRNSDNVLGMYDTVTGTFKTNSGSGTFVAGPDVNCSGASITYTCDAGYYLPAGANTCSICPENSYCTGGEYSTNNNNDQGITSCGTGLYAPTGMWQAAQCGHILHLFLRSARRTTPSLNIDMDNDGIADYFANMTTLDVPMNRDTDRRFKVNYGGQIYSVYDDTVNIGG